MELVAGAVNGRWLRDTLEQAMGGCSRVRAAIAYATADNLRLFTACLSKGKPMEFYGRYDNSVAVDPQVLKWFLDRPMAPAYCGLVPDLLHSKVIWWVDAGAYIGSANLTDRAWHHNIEAGVYLTQAELEQSGMDVELALFFNTVRSQATKLTAEIYDEQRLLLQRRRDIETAEGKAAAEFEKSRLIPRQPPLISFDAHSVNDASFMSFQKEWNDTLEVMRGLAKVLTLPQNRVGWINPSVRPGAIATRFLNAYYSNFVLQGGASHHEELHAQNQASPSAATEEALKWWRAGEFDHAYEEVVLNKWSVRHVELLAKDRVLGLSEAEFIEVLSHIHSVREYANRQDASLLGLAPGGSSTDERSVRWAGVLWKRQSEEGLPVLEVMHQVLWGPQPATRRIWDARYSSRWKILGLDFSGWAEMLGWARPDEFVPRNTRTSKALFALGYPTAIF